LEGAFAESLLFFIVVNGKPPIPLDNALVVFFFKLMSFGGFLFPAAPNKPSPPSLEIMDISLYSADLYSPNPPPSAIGLTMRLL
jgi:hypothetical protein